MPRKTSSATQLKDLKAENEELKLELQQLRKTVARKTPQPTITRKSGGGIKKAAAIFSVICATALLVAGNLLFWAGNTITDSQKFEALVSPIIKDPAVQQAISQFTTERVFERVDVQQLLSENLPPRIQFAAPAIENQVQTATQSALNRALQSDNFQQTWNTALVSIHGRFITFVTQYQGDGTIQLSDIYNKLIERLSGTKLEFLSRVSLPEQVGSVTIANATWLPAAHNIVNNIELYRTLSIILCIGFVALAIWLSRRKRRMAITVGVLFAVFMVLTLVAIRITQSQMVAQAPGAYRDAAQAISESVIDPLVLQTRALFVFAVLISFVAWISGPYKSATLIRTRIQTLFNGNIHQAIIGTHDNAFTHWVGDHKRIIQWLFVAIAAIVIVVSPIGISTIVWTSFVLVVALLICEIIAAPTGLPKT